MEAPERGLPPDEGSSLWQRYGIAAVFLGAGARATRRLDRLPDALDDPAELLRPERRQLHRDRQLPDAVQRRDAPEGDREQPPLALVVPAFVTAVGLVFAVLLERIRFSVAFKVAVFMPMAISLFAAGVIWRLMYEKDPRRAPSTPRSRSSRMPCQPSGALPSALPSTDDVATGRHGGGCPQHAAPSRATSRRSG